MDRAIFHGLALLVALLALAAAPATAEDAPGLDPAEEDLLAWFDTLGYPPLAGRALVRVTTGGWSQGQDGIKTAILIPWALLTEDQPKRFTVLTIALETQEFVPSPPDTPAHARVGFTRLDHDQELAAYFARLVARDNEQPHHERFGERLSERGELVVLARWCAADGKPAIAHRLLVAAAGLPNRQDGEVVATTLREAVALDFTHARMWRTIEDFGNAAVPRRELLARLRAIVVLFPTSPHVARAAETATMLERLVREDEEHARLAMKPLAELTEPERIAELVFRLRDQNGQQWSQPGSCDIFSTPDDRGENPGQGISPAHRLYALGFAAVPQLIAAIGDRRLTRSVGFHRDFYFSHHVLTVGDCAEIILSGIAGRTFFVHTTTSSQMSKEDREADTKATAQAWWDDVQRLGIEAVLVAAVRKAGPGSDEQARRLAQLQPGSCAGPIGDALAKPNEEWLRQHSVHALESATGKEADALLVRIARDDASLGCREVAVILLHRRGHRDALSLAIPLWKSSVTKKSAEGLDTFFSKLALNELATFLAAHGDVPALNVLGKDLPTQSFDLRFTVVGTLGTRLKSLIRGKEPPAVDREVIAALTTMLVAALKDREPPTKRSSGGRRDQHEFLHPRPADFAAHDLAQSWPERYRFDLSADLAERDRQLDAIITSGPPP